MKKHQATGEKPPARMNGQQARQQRLADALRANLKRRKASRKSAAPKNGGKSDEKG